MKNFIIRKIFIRTNLLLETPLILGAGEDILSDADLIRDFDGNAFIPATSFVGVLRSIMSDYFGKEEIDTLFGESGKNSTMSLLTVYDLIPKTYRTAIRDGVELDNENKTAVDKSKYDYEIIEQSVIFPLRLEFNVREKTELNIDKFVGNLIQLLKSGEIRVGAKTSRGFGILKSDEEINILDLDLKQKENVSQLLNFDWDTFIPNKKDSDFSFNRESKLKKDSFEIGCIINKTMLIAAHYNDGDVDATHITSNDEYVIPGTSIAGVFRHHIYNIITNLGLESKKIVDNLFGYVDKENKTAQKSRIIFKESIINDTKSLKMTHNKIDRFTSGTIESALFDEKPIIGGNFKIVITVKEMKPIEKDLILITLKDLKNGLVQIGSSGAIGRGIIDIKSVIFNGEKIDINNINEFSFEME